jgi:hypothetical protein
MQVRKHHEIKKVFEFGHCEKRNNTKGSVGQLNFLYGNIAQSEMDQGWKNLGLIHPTKFENRSTTTYHGMWTRC